MPAHTNIFLVVSSCFFIFFLGYVPSVSAMAPLQGQQLSHFQCSLLPPWLHPVWAETGRATPAPVQEHPTVCFSPVKPSTSP